MSNSMQSGLPPSLGKLVERIEEKQKMDSDTLILYLSDIQFDRKELEPYQDFEHDPSLSYARSKLYEGRNFVIYLMSWTDGDFTAIHSHGVTEWGAVCFLSDIRHRLYEAEERQIRLIEKSVVPKGTIVPVNGDLVHAMGNETGAPSMSLHIYGSNKELQNSNDGSRVYEIEKKLIRTTHGEAFLDLKEANCLHTLSGLTTDQETLTDYLQIILPYYRRNLQTMAVQYLESLLKDPELYKSSEFPTNA